MMKILVVCQHFYPENFRINDLCFELRKKGHDVTVLTGLPNYPKGKVLKEYKYFHNRNQVIKGVKIKRCSLIGRGSTVTKMGLNYLWFAVMGTLKALRLHDSYDIVYVYQLSPITMAWPGAAVKHIQKIPMIIHCLDQWPISVTTGPIDKKSLLYKILYNISKWTYEKADIITISSKSFKKYFESELNIMASNKGLIYLPSYAEAEYSQVDNVENGVFDIVFAGNIGPAQNCETIVECANFLRKHSDIKFHIVGDGLSKNDCKHLAQRYKLNNIVFHGYHDICEMPKFYALADCFIITMVNNEVVNSTLPAKIQSYMLAGKPIIGAISGEVKDVVTEADCGICTDSGNARELAKIIEDNYKNKQLLAMWGENGKQYYESYFDKDKCICELEKIFNKMVEKYKRKIKIKEN